MSAEARGWVYRHSPYTGAVFTVHGAIGDSVNDQNANEFWMAMGTLAQKARLHRKTASAAVAQLLEDGFLEILDDHREDKAGRPSRYRFLFPEHAPVVFETRGVRRETPPPDARVRRETPPGAARDSTGCGLTPRGVRRETPQTEENRSDPKMNGAGGRPSGPPAPGDDLRQRKADEGLPEAWAFDRSLIARARDAMHPAPD